MAKVTTTAAIGAIKGRVGNTTFYVRNGQQVVMASSRSHYRDQRSPEQMTARIKTANVLNLYRYIKDFLDDNFEGVFGGRNKSTFFRKYNYVLRPVMLDKHQSGVGACVLSPYIVSNGKIPEIEYNYTDGMFVSNLQIGEIEITKNTKVGDLASHIQNSNEYWVNGDNLKIILLEQEACEDKRALNEPSCSAIELTLDINNREKLRNTTLCNKDGYLAIKAEGTQTFACALIHTRGTTQTLSASTQKLCLSDSCLYDYYSGEEATAISLTSYKTKGYKK